MIIRSWIVVTGFAVALLACGHKGNGTDVDASGGDDGGGDSNGGGGDGGGDATPLPFDSAIPIGCTAPDLSKPQCSNCFDDDGDGLIDGFDPECSGAADDDENSFATGIPGDNIDAVKQDCFFDGNSGAGDDHCNIHVCCLLGAATAADCPIGANQYDPTQCPPPIGNTPLSQQCQDFCGALTPPGCDCFGCCTACNSTGCYDVLINPTTSPNCNSDNLQDPAACSRCTKITSCGGAPCGGTTCTLCPGQDPSTLPTSCNNMNTCPNGEQSCQTTACPVGSYCSSGCCIGIIQ